MRRELIRYSSSLFLDNMRKTATNNIGWNYLGPAVKDCDMKVWVAAECLCCVETNNIYVWGLQQLEIFEPQYPLSSTRFLFADNLITDDLLVKLGKTHTCTRQSDHYHLFANVFPDFLGDYVFFQKELKQVLMAMLTDDQEEWENCYTTTQR